MKKYNYDDIVAVLGIIIALSFYTAWLFMLHDMVK